MKDVKFLTETYYVGHNGVGHQTGLGFTPNGNCVQLEPINSKSNLAHCVINIPKESIPAVIEQLNSFYNQK
jgi:hypothetical protein